MADEPETTEAKCEAILKRMLELANEGQAIVLERDWGGNTLTITVDGAHTHVGNPGAENDGRWDHLVRDLYNSLHGGPGLSWVGPPDEPPKESP